MKLLKVLSKLDEKSLNRLEDFVHSPYFNKNPKLSQLWLNIRPFSGEDPEIDKVKIWSKIYGSRPYNDGLWRKLVTQLLALVKEFITVEQLRSSSTLGLRLLSEYTEEHQIFEFLPQLLRDLESKSEIEIHFSAFNRLLINYKIARNLDDDNVSISFTGEERALIDQYRSKSALMDVLVLIEQMNEKDHALINLDSLLKQIELIYDHNRSEGKE